MTDINPCLSHLVHSLAEGPNNGLSVPTPSAQPGGGTAGRCPNDIDDRSSYGTIDLDELAYRIVSIPEHPVVQYVRELTVESAVYPAIYVPCKNGT